MLNRTTKTTVMDADQSESIAKVRILRHQPDMHTLAEDVGNRIVAKLKQNPAGCHYFNPAVTVSCPRTSADFFRIVKREQSKWCRRTNSTFSRKATRRAATWVSGGEWITDKFGRYLDRAMCFTGIVFINGQLVPHHHWNPKPGPGKCQNSVRIAGHAAPAGST